MGGGGGSRWVVTSASASRGLPSTGILQRHSGSGCLVFCTVLPFLQPANRPAASTITLSRQSLPHMLASPSPAPGSPLQNSTTSSLHRTSLRSFLNEIAAAAEGTTAPPGTVARSVRVRRHGRDFREFLP